LRPSGSVLAGDLGSSAWGDLGRVSFVLLLLLICGIWLLYYAAVIRQMFALLHMNDFGKFYYSAQMFLAERDMYGPSPATLMPLGAVSHQFWNVNPPHFHLLILPLTYLSAGTALFLWSFGSVIALVASLHLACREAGISWTPLRGLIGVTAVLSFAGFGAVAITGQLSFLLMLPFTLSWVAARRGRWFTSGLWMGICLAVKPFLGVFAIYFLVVRRWRALGGVVTSALASFLVGLLVFGSAAHVSWFGVLTDADWHWAVLNASVTGFLSRSLTINPLFEPLLITPSVVPVVATIGSLVIAFLTLTAAASPGTSIDRTFATLVLGSLLISPLGWLYYVWLAVGPGIAVLRSWSAAARPRAHGHASSGFARLVAALSIPGYLCPLSAVLAGQPAGLATVTLGSAYFWSTLFLWLAITLSVRSPSVSTST
jgi:hypothetical protein